MTHPLSAIDLDGNYGLDHGPHDDGPDPGDVLDLPTCGGTGEIETGRTVGDGWTEPRYPETIDCAGCADCDEGANR